MINLNRALATLALAAVAASPWGCGGSSSSPSTPTPVAAVPTPTPCAQTILFQGSGEMPAGTLLTFPVTVSVSARLDVQGDWTFTTNPVGLYVVQGACGLDQFNARSCNFLLRVEPGAKPLKGSATVTTGSYTVLMANYGARGDSGALQIVQSTGACAPVASVSPSASSGAAEGLQLQRVQMFRQASR